MEPGQVELTEPHICGDFSAYDRFSVIGSFDDSTYRWTFLSVTYDVQSEIPQGLARAFETDLKYGLITIGFHLPPMHNPRYMCLARVGSLNLATLNQAVRLIRHSGIDQYLSLYQQDAGEEST